MSKAVKLFAGFAVGIKPIFTLHSRVERQAAIRSDGAIFTRNRLGTRHCGFGEYWSKWSPVDVMPADMAEVTSDANGIYNIRLPS